MLYYYSILLFYTAMQISLGLDAAVKVRARAGVTLGSGLGVGLRAGVGS